MKKAFIIIFTVLFGIADAILLLIILVSAIISLASWGFGKAKEKFNEESLNTMEYEEETVSNFEKIVYTDNENKYLISVSKEV